MTVWEKRFAALYDILKRGGASEASIVAALTMLGQMLDEARAFGSQRVSSSAHAAMARVISKKGGEAHG